MATAKTPETTAAPAAAVRFRPRFHAHLRFARIAPRKLRYVTELIRGKSYNEAVAILKVTPNRGAVFCRKVLESAMSNANDLISKPEMIRRHRDDYPAEALKLVDTDELHISEIRVDPGPALKRWRPSSMRRPNMIKKRFSHLHIVLQERGTAAKASPSAASTAPQVSAPAGSVESAKPQRKSTVRRASKSSGGAAKGAGKKKGKKG